MGSNPTSLLWEPGQALYLSELVSSSVNWEDESYNTPCGRLVCGFEKNVHRISGSEPGPQVLGVIVLRQFQVTDPNPRQLQLLPPGAAMWVAVEERA